MEAYQGLRRLSGLVVREIHIVMLRVVQLAAAWASAVIAAKSPILPVIGVAANVSSHTRH